MVRYFVAVLIAISLSIACSPPTLANRNTSQVLVAKAPANDGSLQLFATEASAKTHCPKDIVVWLTASGIYHEKGMRWYGQTNGAYVYQPEADAAGDRNTRNGQ